ncbi:MAG: zinc ABC transporter substrate-binding protein [Epsilonproteobacteria bacterium]|nr:zinc ABC transporter substrate-binding protein [Campylobacterota bacterium]
MRLILAMLILTFYVEANLNIAVSIEPQKEIVQKIGKEKVGVVLMVNSGASPHSYEPKANQMIALSKAKLYFSVGVEFEHVWLARFKAQNKNLLIIDSTKGITKMPMIETYHHKGNSLDPHVWTSPRNMKLMAKNIYENMAKNDTKNYEFYKANYLNLLKEIDMMDKKIRLILSKIPKNGSFLVFHPSWGYFAKEYGLNQVSIEVEGKSIAPKALVSIIEQSKKAKVRVIIVQPEFSDKMAQSVAKALNVKIYKISTMSQNWGLNLVNFATMISQ